jgi:hypothetical protein
MGEKRWSTGVGNKQRSKIPQYYMLTVIFYINIDIAYIAKKKRPIYINQNKTNRFMDVRLSTTFY